MLTRSIDYIGDKPSHKCSRCGIIKRYDYIAIRDPCVCKVCNKKSGTKSVFVKMSPLVGIVDMIKLGATDVGPDDSLSCVYEKRARIVA